MATRRSRAGQDRKPFRRAAIFSTTIRLPSRRTAEFCGFAAVEAAKVWKLGIGGWFGDVERDQVVPERPQRAARPGGLHVRQGRERGALRAVVDRRLIGPVD